MKLTITVGVPGSGKTTWAKEQVKQDGNTRLVSRDDIRAMLFGSIENYRFTEDKEAFVSRVETETVEIALQNGKNVIVHDTNLKQTARGYWRFLAGKYQACFEEKFFDVSMPVLLDRNHTRGNNALPVSRLWHMYTDYRLLRGWIPASRFVDKNLPECVIFDVDGTLVKIGQRSPYDFTKVIHDPANTPIQDLFRMYKAAGKKCVVVSGRDGSCAIDTVLNLENTNVLPDAVYMREPGDSRPDLEVKEQILIEQIMTHYNPILAVDDRDSVVGMWRMNGIPCLQVDYGDF